MNKNTVRQIKKNEALNKIRRIYDPTRRFPFDIYDESSSGEQRDTAVRHIIEELERELSTKESSK